MENTPRNNDRLLQPTDVPVNGWTTGTYWYEIERKNDVVSMRYNYDGVNYSTALTVKLPAGVGMAQKIVIDSDNWVTCGHRVDWDYLYVKSVVTPNPTSTEIPTPGSVVPEPTTVLLFGAGLLMLIGFTRKFRK